MRARLGCETRREDGGRTMTEQEWQVCTFPDKMLLSLKSKVGDRKLRLWMVACCRTVAQLLVDERSQKAVETAERFAKGLAAEKELSDASNLAWEAVKELHGGPVGVEHASQAAAW